MSLILQRRVEVTDPHDCTDAADDLSILGAICETLVRRTPDGFVPGLARAWSCNDDATEWTFELVPNRRFDDGSPVDAAAVAASLQRMARPDRGATLGAPAVWRQYLGDLQVITPAADRLVLRLPAPMADLLDVLVQGFIAAPGCLPALDDGRTEALVGSGAYRLSSAAQDEVRLEATGDAPNASLTLRAEPDAGRRLKRLLAGEAAVATNLPWDSTLPRGFTRVETLVPVAIIYLMNAAQGPLADPRLRRAIDLALDRDQIVARVMAGGAQRLDAIVSPLHFGGPAPRQTGPDREASRRLLAEAGHADGLTLTVSCPTRLPDEAQRLTAVLAEQLAAVGIRLDVTLTEDRTAYAHSVRKKQIGDLAVFDSSPLSTFRVMHEKIDSRVAGSWWQGFSNPAVEALIDRARATPAPGPRASLYSQACAAMQQDPPWLTLYNPIRVTGLAGDHPGFTLPVDAVPDFAALPRLP
ncbi:peptide ABC transporter substrate-binding protein [Paracoccus suum]|uniref:Peptide ABC transporter substrate-binding protein n=1 Tax=Paracoccus suum TaxID=2259340 RepID=A0A344PMI8_9RHOB|nr:ABC transporter substrate-binding protein [Paracoccus suum]AXC50593.1 peptide ABC transporter substrate-binding protein [Paracoccus suum]